MTLLATINQVEQLGVEVTSGTSPVGGASRLLRHLQFAIDPDFKFSTFAGAGRRFDSVFMPTYESGMFKPSGPMSYTELIYLYSGLWGTPVITTPTNGVLARQMAWAPKLTGGQGGVTYLFQRGDSNIAQSWNFGQLDGLDLTFDRSKCDISGGSGITWQTTVPITMTASPTPLTQMPIDPNQWNVYLDTSSALIGTTLLGAGTPPAGIAFSVKLSTKGWYAPVWALNRTFASFAGVVDAKQATILTMRVIPDASAAVYWAAARAGARMYLKLDALGLPVDNQYTLNGSASYTSGSFTLTYKGQTTAAIAFNALGSAIQSALTALSTVGSGNAAVTPGATAFNTATTFTVSFSGPLQNDPSLLTANFSLLVGGSPVLTNLSVYFEHTIQACVVPVPKTYQSENNAWSQDWDFLVLDDTAWTLGSASGTALFITNVSNVTAL